MRNSGNNQAVLVTGAAGFIGSHLCDRLLGLGQSVIAIDNLSLGRIENLASAQKNSKFIFIKSDLNQMEATLSHIENALSQFHQHLGTVWHLAANSDIPKGVENAKVDLTDTFLTTFHVLELMKKLGSKQLVFASSSAIYGELNEVLTENSGPLFPISNYGAMKLASEGLITAALESDLENVWIYRFPNVVGGRATHGAIFDFVQKLKANSSKLLVLGDGHQQKPYLHVSELIDAMTLAFEKSRERLNYFNIGQTESSSTVKFMAESVVRKVSPQAQISFAGGKKGWVGDVPKFQFSIEKIAKLGWKPKLTSDQSIEKAVDEILGRA